MSIPWVCKQSQNVQNQSKNHLCLDNKPHFLQPTKQTLRTVLKNHTVWAQLKNSHITLSKIYNEKRRYVEVLIRYSPIYVILWYFNIIILRKNETAQQRPFSSREGQQCRQWKAGRLTWMVVISDHRPINRPPGSQASIKMEKVPSNQASKLCCHMAAVLQRTESNQPKAGN